MILSLPSLSSVLAFRREPYTFITSRRDALQDDVFRTPSGPRPVVCMRGLESFQPDRFKTWNGDPKMLIPQGGGDAGRSHRCPGQNYR